MATYISMVNFKSQYIDARRLGLRLQFYDLSEEDVKFFAESCLLFLQTILDKQFVCQWYCGDNPIKEDKIMTKIFGAWKQFFDFTVRGMVISDIIYNLTSYRKFIQDEYRNSAFDYTNISEYSADYPQYFKEKFDNLSFENYKDAILSVFSEKGKVCINSGDMNDFEAWFSADRHENKLDRIYGHFEVDMYWKCLGKNGDDIAEKFVQFACQMSEKFVNINARIALSPIGMREHMKYFGIAPDGVKAVVESKDLLSDEKFPYKDYVTYMNAREWGKMYYSLGVDWFHIVSPLQQCHIPNLLDAAKFYPDVLCQKLNRGGILLRSCKKLSNVDIDDFIPIKKLLYSALFPGGSKIIFRDFFSFNFRGDIKPRNKWEYIPIFADEITIEKRGIIHFRHKNCKDCKG